MTARIVIECGAAETRAALIENDEIRRFAFAPAMGDENLPRPPQEGDVRLGRVTAVSKALAAAFVDIGAERDGFIPLGKSAPPIEGARVIVTVRRPPLAGKGAVLSLDWKRSVGEGEASSIESLASTAAIGALNRSTSAVLEAFRRCQPSGAPELETLVSDTAAKRALETAGKARPILDARAVEEALIGDAVDESLHRSVELVGGARLSFHETSAGVMIDVDTASAWERAAAARLNDRTNLTAAERLPTELSRRMIGGRVVVDFLPPSGAAARNALVERIKSGLSGVEGFRFGKLAADGLADFTLSKRSFSLLELATEEAGATWPSPGRRLTLDWSAKQAIGALERELRGRPTARPLLLAGAEIATYLFDERPQWAARLASKYGARFEIRENPGMERRSHELA